MPDDYENARKMRQKDMEEAKKHQQEKPFSQRVRLSYYFNTHKAVLGEDVPLPPRAKSTERVS